MYCYQPYYSRWCFRFWLHEFFQKIIPNKLVKDYPYFTYCNYVLDGWSGTTAYSPPKMNMTTKKQPFWRCFFLFKMVIFLWNMVCFGLDTVIFLLSMVVFHRHIHFSGLWTSPDPPENICKTFRWAPWYFDRSRCNSSWSTYSDLTRPGPPKR